MSALVPESLNEIVFVDMRHSVDSLPFLCAFPPYWDVTFGAEEADLYTGDQTFSYLRSSSQFLHLLSAQPQRALGPVKNTSGTFISLELYP